MAHRPVQGCASLAVERLPEQPRNTHGGSAADAGAASLRSLALARFYAPRHWPTWVFVLWLRAVALLPWRWAIKLHKLIGRAMGVLMRRRRAIVRRNIEICFPEWSPSEVERVVSQHFASVGAFVAELAFAWFARLDRLEPLFSIEGEEHLAAALAKGKGVLLFSGHFTPIEICAPMIKRLAPLYGFVSSARRNQLLDAIQEHGRRRTAHVAISNTDVRALLRSLARNAAVWYAPDQVRMDRGVLLPFFGEPCMMSTSTSRVARHSGAAILPLFFCRRGDDSGYMIRFLAPLDDMPSPDPVSDTVRLNDVLEGFVRECPAQYVWTHRKFKNRPEGLPDVYETRSPNGS